MRALVNTFKTLGQSLLFAPSLLVDYLSCSRRLIFPPPPSPPPATRGSPFSLLPLSPLPPPSCLSILASFLSLSKVYIWLLSLGNVPSLVYLFLIIVFRASATSFRWTFPMAFVSFLTQVFSGSFVAFYNINANLTSPKWSFTKWEPKWIRRRSKS